MARCLKRLWHWFRGCSGVPDFEGQVYCTKCGKFIYG
jgi:hypothetical protein